MEKFYRFRRLHELSKGDVFKYNDKGVFYVIRSLSDSSGLIQTVYGKKLRNYQIHKTDMNKEVMVFPDMKTFSKY